VNGVPLDRLKRYTLALPDYLLRGGDGYDMFADSPVLVDPEAGELIVSVLQKVVSAGPVNPETEGRIRIEP
jgi:2',3'-cyclic-nucleotide 2'-phosphodiesterase (5'-nucleotidase family)